MKLIYAEPFKRDYHRLPTNAQSALNKALVFLFTNPRHPSLRAKKLPGTSIWYARISRAYRFTFQYSDDVIVLASCWYACYVSQRKKETAITLQFYVIYDKMFSSCCGAF